MKTKRNSGEHPANVKGVNRVVFCEVCGRKFSTVANSRRMTCVAHNKRYA